MTSDEIWDFVMAEPFRPARITLKDGQTYDVRRPSTASYGRDRLSLYRLASEEPDRRDRWRHIPHEQVESITPLAPAAGNSAGVSP